MSETTTNPTEVIKDLEKKIEKVLNLEPNMATKADFETLSRDLKTLKATVMARDGEDEANKSISKYANGKAIWTKSMKERAYAIVAKAMEQANGWQ